jgi:hypothetical protein
MLLLRSPLHQSNNSLKQHQTPLIRQTSMRQTPCPLLNPSSGTWNVGQSLDQWHDLVSSKPSQGSPCRRQLIKAAHWVTSHSLHQGQQEHYINYKLHTDTLPCSMTSGEVLFSFCRHNRVYKQSVECPH